MKQNLAGKILGKIKIFGQDFVTIVTGIRWDHKLQRQNLFMAFNGFLNGSNIGSTVSCRGETHRYTVHLLYINRHAGTPNKTKTKDTMSLDYRSACNIGSRVVRVSMKEVYR